MSVLKPALKTLSILLLVFVAIYLIASDAFSSWWAKLSVSHNLDVGLDVLTPITIIGSIIAFSIQAVRHRQQEQESQEEKERFKRQIEKLKRTRQTVLENLLDITGVLGDKQVALVAKWQSYNEHIDLLHKQMKIPSESRFKSYDGQLEAHTDALIDSIKAFYASFKAKHFAIFPTLSAIEELELQDRQLKIGEIDTRSSKNTLDEVEKKLQIARITQGQDPEYQTTRESILDSMGNLERCIESCNSYGIFLQKRRELLQYIARTLKGTRENFIKNKTDSEPAPDFRKVTRDKLVTDERFILLVMDLFTLDNPYIDNWLNLLVVPFDKETEKAVKESVEIARGLLLHGIQNTERSNAWNMVSKNLVNAYLDVEIEDAEHAYSIQRYLALQTTYSMAEAINASTALMVKLSALCSITMNETHNSSFKQVVDEFEDSESLGYSLIETVQVYEFVSDDEYLRYIPKTVNMFTGQEIN